MEEYALRQPELVGRDQELGKLKHSLQNALEGKGSTIFIAGEAGIGKTRLVSELISDAEKNGAQVIRGWCLAESLEPLMPVKVALREAGLFHLISGDPPPLVVSAYLMNDAGMLIAKAEREQLELDSDIFAGMLQAVGNFVQDSLEMMAQEGGASLNTLGYGDYTILIRPLGKLTLAVVIKGEKSEFLIEDMKAALAHFGNSFNEWTGNMAATEPAKPKVSWFVNSGKYDGKFLVDDPKLRQENLFDNVLLGMQRLSENRPLLLFLDDLQWADPTSLNLVHYLARNTRKFRVLMLGTYRPEDIVQGYDGKPHQLETAMQNMSREDLLEKIELKRLDKEATKSIIDSTLVNANFDPAFYDRIHKETDGTPFFVLEIVKLLVEEGAIAPDGSGAWALTKELDKLDLPGKVYDVVKRRLDRLMKEQRKILDCASVVGDEFRSDVIGKAMELNKLQLLENLSEIEKSHKLLHYLKDRYRFDHAKIREVLYNGIGEELRREYHRLIADTIAELHRDNPDDVVGDLAYHYFEAQDEKAGEYLIRAADKAAERYANEEAVRLYGSALDLIGEEKPVILEKLAGVQVIMGEYDKAIENLIAAKDLTEDMEANARLMRKVGRVYEKKSEYDKSLEILAEAKELATPGSAEHGRILYTAGCSYMNKGDYDRAMPILLDSLEIAEKPGSDKKDLGDALRAIGLIHKNKGEYDSAMQYYEKSLAVMEKAGIQYGIAYALNNIGLVHDNRGDLDKALEFHGRSLEIKEKIGDRRGIAISLSNIGLMHVNRGELDKGLEFHRRSLEIKEKIGDRWGIAISLNNIGYLYHYIGELDKALNFIRRSLDIRENIGSGDVNNSLVAIGMVHHAMGDFDTALNVLERSLEKCREKGNLNVIGHVYYGIGDTYLSIGDLQKALEYSVKAVENSLSTGSKGVEDKARSLLGAVYREMGEHEKAREEFERSISIIIETKDFIELGRAYYEHALLFKAKGDPAQARELLEKALAEYDRMGMKLWAGKCRKALEELG